MIPSGWERPVERTTLELDVADRTGRAAIVVAPGPAAVSFEVGSLTIEEVRGLAWRQEGSALHVWAPGEQPVDVVVRYRFQVEPDGWLATGASRTWPYYCGNVFPCRPHPREAAWVDIAAVRGVPADQVAVFPEGMIGPLPAYAVGLAVGPYTYVDLGETAGGTRLGVWHLPGTDEASAIGTEDLVAMFGWLEQLLGPYPYGDRAGAVEVDWTVEEYGAMEHHPYWHVDRGSMSNGTTHAHEVVHAWFGNLVRLRCWEDITLSEGVASYLAARAVGAVQGEQAEASVWRRYAQRLQYAREHETSVAWPEGCDRVDVLRDGLFGETPYMMGAHFLRAVEQAVGQDALDRALGVFTRRFAGGVAGVQDLLDVIEAETGFDPGELAEEWLRRR